MSFGDVEPVVAFFAQHRVFDIIEPATQRDQRPGEREVVRIAEIAIEAEPGEEFGQVLRGRVVEHAAVDQFAEDQAIVVEHARPACRPFRLG